MSSFVCLADGFDAGAVFWLFVLAWWGYQIASRIRKKQEETEWLKQNPAVYVEMQRIEHEKQKMEHEKKQSALKIGGEVGGTLLRLFLKR